MLVGGLIQEGLTLKFANVTLYFNVPMIVIFMLVCGCVIILAVVIDQTQRNMEAKMALQARNENK